jgi:hypothetical protein
MQLEAVDPVRTTRGFCRRLPVDRVLCTQGTEILIFPPLCSSFLRWQENQAETRNFLLGEPQNVSPQHAARTGTGRWQKQWEFNCPDDLWQHHSLLPFLRWQENRAESRKSTNRRLSASISPTRSTHRHGQMAKTVGVDFTRRFMATSQPPPI